MPKTPGRYTLPNGKVIDISRTGVVSGAGSSILLEYRFRFKELGVKAAMINSALRYALEGAGEFWIKTFMPKRWDPSYARMFLGYKSTKAYDDWKVKNQGQVVNFTRNFAGFVAKTTVGRTVVVASPQPQPMVLSGASKAAAEGSARPQAKVTKNTAKLVVKVQLGAINFLNHDAFTFVPRHENERVVAEAERILRKEILPTIANRMSKYSRQRQIPSTQERALSG